MAYEQRDNSGSLFKNARKEKDTHPDFNGSILVDGKAYWISGWKKKKQSDGETWLSLSVKPKDAAPKQEPQDDGFGDEPQSQGAPPRKAAPIDDDVPFAPCM